MTAPPEPDPIVVTANGHTVTIPADEAAVFTAYWSDADPVSPYEHAAIRLAGLLDQAHNPNPDTITVNVTVNRDVAQEAYDVWEFTDEPFQQAVVAALRDSGVTP